MKTGALVAIDSLAWLMISAIIGFVGACLPDRFVLHDTAITKPRAWERGGRVYRRFGVQRWKTALPETNRVGPGERVSKRSLPQWTQLEALVGETRRAEYVHLAIACAGPLFLLWNPWPLGVAMVIFGVLFNTPFIIIQRYNRIRLQRVVRRLANRS